VHLERVARVNAEKGNIDQARALRLPVLQVVASRSEREAYGEFIMWLQAYARFRRPRGASVTAGSIFEITGAKKTMSASHASLGVFYQWSYSYEPLPPVLRAQSCAPV